MKKKIKILFVTALASLMFVSCGGAVKEDSTSKESQIEDAKVDYDIEYSTLTYNRKKDKYFVDKDEKELFSGTAGEKNSSDQLIKLATIKNGFLASRKEWTDFGGELFLTEDMEYKDGNWFNGWYTYINTKRETEQIRITESYNVYKNGKKQENESWNLSITGSSWNNKSYLLIGEEGYNNATCECEGNFYYPNGGGGNVEEISKFFDCVKSKNLKNFHVFINK